LFGVCVEVPRRHYDVGRNAFNRGAQPEHRSGLEVNGAIRDIQPLHRGQPEHRGDTPHFIPSGGHHLGFILWGILPRPTLKPATSLTIENGYDVQLGQSTVAQ
jgi:hypothetical protein